MGFSTPRDAREDRMNARRRAAVTGLAWWLLVIGNAAQRSPLVGSPAALFSGSSGVFIHAVDLAYTNRIPEALRQLEELQYSWTVLNFLDGAAETQTANALAGARLVIVWEQSRPDVEKDFDRWNNSLKTWISHFARHLHGLRIIFDGRANNGPRDLPDILRAATRIGGDRLTLYIATDEFDYSRGLAGHSMHTATEVLGIPELRLLGDGTNDVPADIALDDRFADSQREHRQPGSTSFGCLDKGELTERSLTNVCPQPLVLARSKAPQQPCDNSPLVVVMDALPLRGVEIVRLDRPDGLAQVAIHLDLRFRPELKAQTIHWYATPGIRAEPGSLPNVVPRWHLETTELGPTKLNLPLKGEVWELLSLGSEPQTLYGTIDGECAGICEMAPTGPDTVPSSPQ